MLVHIPYNANSLRQIISKQIVGVPVTLNGDLKNQFVETTVGFDTICKVKNCYVILLSRSLLLSIA